MKIQHSTAACMMIIWFCVLNGNPERNLLEFTLITLWIARPTVCQNALIQFYKNNNPSLLIKGLPFLFLFQCGELRLKKTNSYKRSRLVLKTRVFMLWSSGRPAYHFSTVFFELCCQYYMFHMPPCGLQGKREILYDLVNWKCISVNIFNK